MAVLLQNLLFINVMSCSGVHCTSRVYCRRIVDVYDATHTVERIFAELLEQSTAVRVVYMAQMVISIDELVDSDVDHRVDIFGKVLRLTLDSLFDIIKLGPVTLQ